MEGDNFVSELGGIMKVATWLCTPLLVGLYSSLGLVPNYVVSVVGNVCGVLNICQTIIHMA